MKLATKVRARKHAFQKSLNEDYRYLQQKISGKSVYKGLQKVYKRMPKHRKRDFLYQ